MIVISSWAVAREAYRSRDLRQGLYDGGVVMENVLINLHGTEHRDRRRLENPIFRRDVLFDYEHHSFPEVLRIRLRPHLETGNLELLSFGHAVMLELAAVNAGVDLRPNDPEATERLRQQLLLFIDGARILHYKGDREAKEREVASALADFETEFIAPALARRQKMVAAGEHPRDILGVLVENGEGLDLDHSTMVRETAFFLLTGASTSAVALCRTLHNIFHWIETHPQDEQRLCTDDDFVQRCMLESLRLAPISPIAARWATRDIELADGTKIADGDRVHIDMGAANRDPAVFGEDANHFRPNRELLDDVPRAGVSFGHGMHHCIGQELAVGVPEGTQGLRLFGLVGVVIQELLRLGVRPDPADPPEVDTSSERGTFRRYPVLIDRPTEEP